LYVGESFLPEEVFDDEKLTDWALFHGFVEVSEE
jgi:hypothetical protein